MKKLLHFSLLLFFSLGIFNASTAQVVYVKHDAAGTNDGSSWANAYTDLQMAIDSSTATQIWLAAGTYKPGGASPTDSSSFTLRNNLAIYGGFNGTETDLSQRDYMTNETILSGDMAGDDVDNDFDNNRTDNVRHIVMITEDVNVGVVLDGLTFVGGNTDGADGMDDNRRGAGILMRGKATVRNCTFRQNYGYFGAGVYPRDSAARGAVIDNCIFINNAGDSGVGVLVAGALDVVISNCTFQNNFANDGAGLYATRSSLKVSNCNFTDNTANSFGGALFSYTSIIQILDSEFINNRAANAGGIYIDAGGEPAVNAIIKNCNFEANKVTDFGGAAFYSWNINFNMDSCKFKSNSGPHAGAMYNDGRDNFSSFIIKNSSFENNDCTGFGGAVYNWACRFIFINCNFKTNFAATAAGIFASGGSKYELKDCVFFENNASGGWGGGVASYQQGTSGTITDCEFTRNIARTSGGGMIIGFKSDVKINTSSFNENVARFGAGIYTQNDSTQLTINSAEFKGNRAENNGGGIFISGGGLLNVDQSKFEVNNADIGGAISMAEDSVNIASLNLSNTTLTFNIAQNQGGGVWLSGTDATITNCLFNGNIALGQGLGGALSNNAANGDTTFLNLINNTIVNNTAANSAGLSFWEQADSGDLNAQILNTIVYNPEGINYFIEEGTPNLSSLGGNLSGDNTMLTILTETNDLNETNPLFENLDDEDFHLSMASPCINKGIEMGAPLLDLEGNPRVGEVDMGAYEFQGVVSTEELVLSPEQLEVFPNPSINHFSFRLENDWKGNVDVVLYNILGQKVLQTSFEKSGTLLQQKLNISQLQKGKYLLVLKKDKFLVTQGLLKL